MENKYFTPKLEDIHVGYECEMLSYNCGSVYKDEGNGKFSITHAYACWNTEVITNKTLDAIITILSNPIPSDRYVSSIRTPYLTKDKIEAEGWLYKGKTQDIWFEKEGRYDMGSWTAYKAVMQYGLDDHRLRIYVVDIVDKLEYDCFRGECKSINEFKTLMRWLKI